jgi:hypothetical protein
MLTPMDHERRRQVLEDAERLLRDRYGVGSDHLDPVAVMNTVRGRAFSAARPGRPSPEVPAEDVLAALTQIEGARADLDALERDLIRAARQRRASWQRIADALGLATRQSAETRALRLERATARAGGRDVAAQRLEQARQRSADAWCEAHRDRFREVGESLVDASGAWPQLKGDPMLHMLAAMLAAGVLRHRPARRGAAERVRAGSRGGGCRPRRGARPARRSRQCPDGSRIRPGHREQEARCLELKPFTARG